MEGFDTKVAGEEGSVAASDVERAFAMAALATAMAQKAMEAAQKASAKQADAEKQAEESNQADEDEEEEDTKAAPAAPADAFASDSEDDEEEDGMDSLEYIMTYKELPPFEVELILGRPVRRMPFADSKVFKDLIADPSTTQEAIDKRRT